MSKKQKKKESNALGVAGLIFFVFFARAASGHGGIAGVHVPHVTAATAVPAAGGPYTPRSWAAAFLAAIPEPRTPCNMGAVEAWEGAEGGAWNNDAHGNPLNTTEREPGSYSINSVGVQSFTSWQEGLQANVHVIRLGYYTGIRAAMAAGDSAQAVADAVASSPWGTSSFSANC